MQLRRVNYAVLDPFLKDHPTISWKEFEKTTPEKCSIWVFHTRRRHLGLLKAKRKYSKRSSYTRKQTIHKFSSTSKIGQLVLLLEQHPDGITNDGITKALNIETKTMSNLIYRLKREFNYKITHNANGYHLKLSTKSRALTPVSNQLPIQPQLQQPQQEYGMVNDFKSMGFDFKLVVAELEGLPREKKLNYIDQLERSMFFRMSSQAIKSADRISQQLVALISS